MSAAETSKHSVPAAVAPPAGQVAPSLYNKKDLELEKGYETASVRDEDVKTSQKFRGWTLVWLALQSIGTVYGDIGTSPLYVFSSVFSEPPDREETLCSVSLIIWSLFLVVTVKYVLITLYADDAGEGGTFALYSLLARYANIEDREPGKPAKEINRYKTGDLTPHISSLRRFFEENRKFKLSVRFAAIFGVCCVLADGVFTPAQSVLGAIQGIRVYNPDLSKSAIIGISCGILILLFALQPLGINRLANGFAPIIVVWLLFNVACAIYNLAKFDAAIFEAFNPYHAGRWFVIRGSDVGFRRLGGILLCFTGVEALFADMGAFSRGAIQMSWLCFAWPCLTLTYIGQAANISVNPENFANPFFLTLPPGCLWPGLILSILAAIVASQAMVTGCFQILSQAMSLCYFPRIRIKFTSTVVHNQCYVPLANWLLMIGCVIVTAVFNNTTSLGNAYGLCVILVTMVTSCLVSLVAMLVWRFNPFLIVLPIFAIFITLDGLWLATSVFKFPDGAWVTVAIAFALSAVMIVWRYGKTMQWKAEGEQIAALRRSTDLSREYGTIEGVGVFFDETNDRIPGIYTYWLQSFEARHRFTIFVHLRQAYHPTVNEANRYHITPLPELPNTYKVLIRYGYNEAKSAINASSSVVGAMTTYLDIEKANSRPGTPRYEKVLQQLEELDRARSEKRPIFLFGRKTMQARRSLKNPVKRGAVWAFATIRDLMTSKPKLWSLPADQVVEIGKAVEL